MVSHPDEVNRFAYVPKDWTDVLSSQHNPCPKGIIASTSGLVVDARQEIGEDTYANGLDA